MRLPKFECLYPTTLQEALNLLDEHKDEARIIAGGTDLVVAMKQRRAVPKYLINPKNIANLSTISFEPANGASIGALVTLDEIANSRELKQAYPSLCVAASRVATAQIRNAGTIGGNIALDSRCWYYNQSEFWRSTRPPCIKAGGDVCYVVRSSKQCYSLISSDTAPALISLDAAVELASKNGSRVLPIENLYTGIGQTPTAIGPGELLTRVMLPIPTRRGVYLKHAYRGSIDFPLVGVAVSVSLDGANDSNSARPIKDIKIAVGAATPAPVRAIKAEEILNGHVVSEDLLEAAGKAATNDVIPIVHIYAPVTTKRRMVEVLVKRAVQQAIDQD
jgi:4-hydroxybenzoyl-CoA reductase subunit beta